MRIIWNTDLKEVNLIIIRNSGSGIKNKKFIFTYKLTIIYYETFN